MPNPIHFIQKQNKTNYFQTYVKPEGIIANFVCRRVNSYKEIPQFVRLFLVSQGLAFTEKPLSIWLEKCCFRSRMLRSSSSFPLLSHQLCSDPYFTGVEILVQKDWMSSWYNASKRTGWDQTSAFQLRRAYALSTGPLGAGSNTYETDVDQNKTVEK